MTNQALPQRTRQLVERHHEVCRHLGLMLDKFAPWDMNTKNRSKSVLPIWNLSVKIKVKRRGEWVVDTATDTQAKSEWLKQTDRYDPDTTPPVFAFQRLDPALMQMQYERWTATMSAYGENARIEHGYTDTPLVVGLGTSHVLETALSLDRNSSAPYIAGSSLKGLTRTVALYEIADLLGVTTEVLDQLVLLDDILMTKAPDPDKPETSYLDKHFPDQSQEICDAVNQFRTIFGHQGQAGTICFMNAVCATFESNLFATDVMTPHYVYYYRGKQLPSDDQEPSPVSYLTIKPGVHFAFGIRARRPDNAHLLETTIDWLKFGLTELGIGGKTSQSYGLFQWEDIQ